MHMHTLLKLKLQGDSVFSLTPSYVDMLISPLVRTWSRRC